MRKYFGLFFEMGTGKTCTAIHIHLQKIKQEGRPLKTLVLCPLVVVPNWGKEFYQWTRYKPTLLTGSGKKRIKTFNEKTMLNQTVFVTNYEALQMKELFQYLCEWGPEFLIYDESHKLKTPNTQRTKKSLQLSLASKYRLILSGTPVLNSAMDLFSQYLILDHGKSFGKNYYAFRHRYFYDKNWKMPRHCHFPDWQMRPAAECEINETIKRDSMRVTKEECLDLPPLVKEVRYVEMSKEQAKLYKEMKQDFITFLKNKAVVAQLAITKGLRLQQIVSGFVKTADAEEIALGKNQSLTPRETELKTLLSELTPSHKVIVWAVFKHNFKQIASICKSLGIEYVEVHGEISAKNKQVAIEQFNTRAECRVYIGHPGAGGIGVNLTAAPYSIYYSRNFSLEADAQSEARNHRGGSEVHDKITRIDLVTKDTIDEIVMNMLAKKANMGEELLKTLRVEL